MLDKNSSFLLKNACGNLAAGLFLAFFGAVYEYFSFGVWSPFMIYAFMIPLMLGTLPFLTLAVRKPVPADCFAVRTWNSGIAALSVGCVFKGVLEIYGTTNRLLPVYPINGAVLMVIGAAAFLLRKPKLSAAG